jgi:hypothetical protein
VRLGGLLRRLYVSGLVALAVLAGSIASGAAQPVGISQAGATIRAANALAARIAAYHRGPGLWTGASPPPATYCSTMQQGEAVMKELARLASRAILYRLPDLASALQAAGNRLGDELDEEEIINQAAGIPYTVYPCPVPGSAYPVRATFLFMAERRMPTCSREADALRVSFAARRTLVQQCLR